MFLKFPRKQMELIWFNWRNNRQGVKKVDVHVQLNDENKTKCSSMDSGHTVGDLGHQIDMKDLWRIVQKDVEAEYLGEVPPGTLTEYATSRALIALSISSQYPALSVGIRPAVGLFEGASGEGDPQFAVTSSKKPSDIGRHFEIAVGLCITSHPLRSTVVVDQVLKLTSMSKNPVKGMIKWVRKGHPEIRLFQQDHARPHFAPSPPNSSVGLTGLGGPWSRRAVCLREVRRVSETSILTVTAILTRAPTPPLSVRKIDIDSGITSRLITLICAEALSLDCRYEGNAHPMCTASADSILDGHEEEETEFHDRWRSDYASCPHLPGTLVTSGTQTDPSTRSTKRRAPQIAEQRNTTVNTSTGSSTSGVGSVSSKSEFPPTTYNRKSVQIVETACTPDSAYSPDGERYPGRRRSSSFKNAIERGQSGDSSTFSFDTCDPASTSPDISPDHFELPAYPDSGGYYEGPYLHSSYNSHRSRHRVTCHQQNDRLQVSSGLRSSVPGHLQENSGNNSPQRGILRSSISNQDTSVWLNNANLPPNDTIDADCGVDTGFVTESYGAPILCYTRVFSVIHLIEIAGSQRWLKRSVQSQKLTGFLDVNPARGC
ncbi:hypothetical protein CAPTEDRAFT_206382 [Capitella teleta]|uniref:Uncharacterized protein n=1 Tax=Capitella teleta TaxID=283909 RepID=R7TG36_CAPTE|nr:hypothetical protein CAPTEDRAFT_206382 [Capitella teleta]|eukprot:ELT90011.1 hypothetical protein CAPTEDRAFT_206382 [Capitella teleta]